MTCLQNNLVSSSMLLGQSHEIINNFFYFTYAHNTGVAWGMFAGKLGLFIVVAIIVSSCDDSYF